MVRVLGTSRRGRLFGLSVAGGSLALILVLHPLESSQVFEAPVALALLNTIFLGASSLGMAYLAAKSYQSTGSVGFLLSGCGLMVFGLSSLLAGWVMPLAGAPNPTVTLHNIGSLFAGLLQLLAAHFFLRDLTGNETSRRRVPGYKSLYLSILALVSVLALLSYAGYLPVFFDRLSGPSPIRQFVLRSAILLFAAAGLMFVEIFAVAGTEFAYWFGLALLLIAIGLIAVLLQHAVGSPLGWAGRVAQYLGSVFFLIAFLQGKWEFSAEGSIATIRSEWEMWPFLESKVRERTTELTRLNSSLELEMAERSRMAGELSASEERFRQLVNSIEDIIYTLDREQRHTGVFGPWVGKSGLTPDHFLGKSARDIFGESATVHEEANSRALAGEYLIYDWSTAGEGGSRHYQTSLSPMRDSSGAIVGIVGLGRDVTDRKKNEESLRRSEATIKKSLEEKDTLLRELYHRTKNNMAVIISLLKMQAAGFDDPKLRNAFKETENRILSMSLVHQKLYKAKDLSHINLKEYIADLAFSLRESYGMAPGRLSLVFDLEDAFVLIDTAVPCGLILNELLSNSYKHAFPGNRIGTIKVSLSMKESKGFELLVADDGVGVPEGFDFRADGHLGLLTVFALAEEQLRGQVRFENSGGLRCRLVFNDIYYEPRV